MRIYIQKDWILKANIAILDPHFKTKKKRLDRSWKNRLFNKCGRILCLFLYYLLKFKELFKTNRLFPGYDLINLKAFNWTNTITRFYVYNEDANLCISGDTRLTLLCSERNGIFPAISVNKDVTFINNCSRHKGELVSTEGPQEGKNICHLAAVWLQPLPNVLACVTAQLCWILYDPLESSPPGS